MFEGGRRVRNEADRATEQTIGDRPLIVDESEKIFRSLFESGD